MPLGVEIAIGVGIDSNPVGPSCRRLAGDVKSLVIAAHVVDRDSATDPDPDPDSINPSIGDEIDSLSQGRRLRV
jgi:hypothetical protein